MKTLPQPYLTPDQNQNKENGWKDHAFDFNQHVHSPLNLEKAALKRTQVTIGVNISCGRGISNVCQYTFSCWAQNMFIINMELTPYCHNVKAIPC